MQRWPRRLHARAKYDVSVLLTEALLFYNEAALSSQYWSLSLSSIVIRLQ